MPLMKAPHGAGEVNVNDEDVDRYKAAGWTQKSGSKSSGSSKGSTSGKSSK